MEKDPIREKIEEHIMKHLKYGHVQAVDLKYLSEAWHNLHQADLMMEILNNPGIGMVDSIDGKAELSAASNVIKSNTVPEWFQGDQYI